MKRERFSAFTTAIGAVLSLALAAYMAAGLWGVIENDLRWAEVRQRNVERSFTASGIIIRNEILLEGGQAADAQRLGAGDSMGEGFSAPASGLYFGTRDGYEYLSPGQLSSLDGPVIKAFLTSAADEGSGGKLVTGKDWYFAALLPSGLSLEPGARLRADFGLGETACYVYSAGEGFAVLHMDTFLAEHAALRKGEAKIITETHSGLAIPKAALRKEGGESFVWTSAAGRLEKKKVNIIFTGEDFILVSLNPEAGALREGDRVLIAGEDLYEGKIIT